MRRISLIADVKANERALAKATARLRLAQTFVVRIFTTGAVPKLIEASETADEKLEVSRAQLEGCFVEVDFAFDDPTLGTYAALVRTFDGLRACQRIWDITSTAATNRVVERTIATQRIARTPVQFDYVASTIVRSEHQAVRLGNVAGRELQIFPGFIMMRDSGGDFALIEYRELDMQLSQSRFIEEEKVPTDTEVVGQTWSKANKDGSPDRRFKDNHAIPIVKYGELLMRSPTGLLEAYQFSNFGTTESFATAFANHKRALANLTSRGDQEPPAGVNDEAADVEPSSLGEPTDTAHPARAKPKSLVFDWVALVMIVVGLGWGGAWVVQHGDALKASVASAFAPAVPPPVPVTAPPEAQVAPKPKAHRTHRRHHAHQPAPAVAQSSSEASP